MSRVARYKISDGEAWYHLRAKVAGREGEYFLQPTACQRFLVGILKHYTRAYCCEVAAFCAMGNHWHGVVYFEAPRKLEEEELRNRANLLYPGKKGQEMLDGWGEKEWKRFESRMFNVSELMRNVQSVFARWYNGTYDRYGRFWADRFHSTVLESESAVLDCMQYVELNPVRAGLVERPEDYRGSSFYLRSIRKSGWLMPLNKLFEDLDPRKALRDYRYRLYWRGNVATKEGQAQIPRDIAEQESEAGYGICGAFLQRLRYFSEGLIVGREAYVRQRLTKLRRKGYYLRRIKPISQLGGIHYSLREQRSNALRS